MKDNFFSSACDECRNGWSGVKNISGLHTSALVLSGIAPRIKHSHKTLGLRPRVLCSCFMLGVIPDKTAASVCNPYIFLLQAASISSGPRKYTMTLQKKRKEKSCGKMGTNMMLVPWNGQREEKTIKGAWNDFGERNRSEEANKSEKRKGTAKLAMSSDNFLLFQKPQRNLDYHSKVQRLGMFLNNTFRQFSCKRSPELDLFGLFPWRMCQM